MEKDTRWSQMVIWLAVAGSVVWLMRSQVIPLIWALIASVPLRRYKQALAVIEANARKKNAQSRPHAHCAGPEYGAVKFKEIKPQLPVTTRAKLMRFLSGIEHLAVTISDLAEKLWLWMVEPFRRNQSISSPLCTAGPHEVKPVAQPAAITAPYFAVLYRLFVLAIVHRIWRHLSIGCGLVLLVMTAQVASFLSKRRWRTEMELLVIRWDPEGFLTIKVLLGLLGVTVMCSVLLALLIFREMQNLGVALGTIAKNSDDFIKQPNSSAARLLKSIRLPEEMAIVFAYSMAYPNGRQGSSESPSYPTISDSISKSADHVAVGIGNLLPAIAIFLSALWYILESQVTPKDVVSNAADSIGPSARRLADWLFDMVERLVICAFKRTSFYLIYVFSIATIVDYPYPVLLALICAWAGLFATGTPEAPVIALGIMLLKIKPIAGILTLLTAGFAWWFVILGIHAEVPGQNTYWVGLCLALGVLEFKNSLGIILGPLIGCLPLHLITYSGRHSSAETQGLRTMVLCAEKAPSTTTHIAVVESPIAASSHLSQDISFTPSDAISEPDTSSTECNSEIRKTSGEELPDHSFTPILNLPYQVGSGRPRSGSNPLPAATSTSTFHLTADGCSANLPRSD